MGIIAQSGEDSKIDAENKVIQLPGYLTPMGLRKIPREEEKGQPAADAVADKTAKDKSPAANSTAGDSTAGASAADDSTADRSVL